MILEDLASIFAPLYDPEEVSLLKTIYGTLKGSFQQNYYYSALDQLDNNKRSQKELYRDTLFSS